MDGAVYRSMTDGKRGEKRDMGLSEPGRKDARGGFLSNLSHICFGFRAG
jgi:hypothetical protein